MNADNAVVNIPLRKRGDIDAQLDRYNAQKSLLAEQSTRDARNHRVALLAEARGLIEMVSDARMTELGKPHGMDARKTRKTWHAIAERAPSSVIAAMRKELAA